MQVGVGQIDGDWGNNTDAIVLIDSIRKGATLIKKFRNFKSRTSLNFPEAFFTRNKGKYTP